MYQLRQWIPTFLVLSLNEKLMVKSFLVGVFLHWQLKLFSCLLSANINSLLHTNALLQVTVLDYSTVRLNNLDLVVAKKKV